MGGQTNQIMDDAFGFLPDRLFLMTAAHEGNRSGMLVSSVSRCCDTPDLICVSGRKGHIIDPLIRDSHSFAIGIVDPEDNLLRKRFKSTNTVPSEHNFHGENDPFDAIESQTMVTGSPILSRCVTWFDCEVLRRIDLESEMELFVGVILAVLHNGERREIDRDVLKAQSDERLGRD